MMSGIIRPEVVEALASAMSEPGQSLNEHLAAVAAIDATEAERAAAARIMADACVSVLRDLGVLVTVEPPTLLSLTYREIMTRGWQGRALLALADELAPIWASRPDTPLSDVCKTLPPDRLTRISAELRRIGLRLDRPLP